MPPCGHRSQGLAHRRAGDPELLGETGLNDPGAGLMPATRQFPGQKLHNSLMQVQPVLLFTPTLARSFADAVWESWPCFARSALEFYPNSV
jgi:hypothetical protein